MNTNQNCPFTVSHDQDPVFKSDDPIAQINAGNFGKAIQILISRTSNGSASAEDWALLGHAKRNTGDFTAASDCFIKALKVDPHHKWATTWQESIVKNARDGRSGVGIQRLNTITKAYLETDPAKAYQGHRDAWVLCNDFLMPDVVVPKRTLWDHLRNTKESLASKVLLPVGYLSTLGATPGNPGRWTQHRIHILKLAALAYGRSWMEKRERDPDGERGTPPGQIKGTAKRPKWSDSGFSPDGAYVDDRSAGEARVGTEFIDHGMPKGFKPKDVSGDDALPSEAELAKEFGYRNGNIIEAKTASFHAAAHLQQLVHDVAQTAPDNQKKHAIPIDPDRWEADLGVKYDWSRSDAPNVFDPDRQGMHGTTVWWDMSHLYGSDIETLAKIRSFPNGSKVLGGKIYLEGMDEEGNGGEWLPLEKLPDGSKQILTGFGRNMTAPLEAEHTLYARHHNWVCGVLHSRHPKWSDNQLFQVARRVITMTYVKIHTGTWTHTLFANRAVVDGLNANLFGRAERKLPHFEKKIYRPKQGNDPVAHGIAAGKVDKKKPEVKGKYFSKAYRFGHQIWVDELKCPPIGERVKEGVRKVNMTELRELEGHEFLKSEGLGNMYYYMMNTRLGAPVPGNTADFFRDMATEAGVMNLFEQEIRKDRQRGNPSFTNYQRAHNIPPIQSWQDLFVKPNSQKSQETIRKLESLYPGGVETLDSVIGLILNEHRPQGLAITNEGFQTFVQEATSRIRKNPWLTEKWSPEMVGWTAINLVEAIDKEKLIYLHCPELREWLESREVINTYEYVGTSPKEAPDEHPLETTGIITWGDQHITDVGLGDAWRVEHFKNKVTNTMLRVEHSGENRYFVVDISEGIVYADFENKGRLFARNVVHEPTVFGISTEEIMHAAHAIIEEHEKPWPGSHSADYPEYKSGWLLTQKEVNVLKKYQGDKTGEGVRARLTDLEAHILVFNLSNDIENLSFGEHLHGWRTIESSRMRALFQTVGSIFAFGKIFKASIPLANLSKQSKRPKKATGVFGPDGNIDEARLAETTQIIEMLSNGYEGGIPESVFLSALEEKELVDSLTKRQWGSLFRLIDRLTGKKAITTELFKEFYSGELLIRAFEQFSKR